MSQFAHAGFGRRGAPPKRREIPPPPTPGALALDGSERKEVIYEEPILAGRAHPGLAAIGRALSQQQKEEDAAETAAARGKTPFSRAAVWLAAISAGALQAAALIGSKQGVVEIIPGLHFDLGKDGKMSAMLIVTGLLRGARIAGVAIIAAHFLMRLIRVAHPIAYGIAGAAAGAAIAWLLAMRTGVPPHAMEPFTLLGLAIAIPGVPPAVIGEALTGFVAAVLYRFIAGSRGK